jgi:hypothetical protein
LVFGFSELQPDPFIIAHCTVLLKSILLGGAKMTTSGDEDAKKFSKRIECKGRSLTYFPKFHFAFLWLHLIDNSIWRLSSMKKALHDVYDITIKLPRTKNKSKKRSAHVQQEALISFSSVISLHISMDSEPELAMPHT